MSVIHSPLVRRISAFTLLLVVAVSAFAAVGYPIFRVYHDQKNTIADLEFRLGKINSVATTGSKAKALLDKLERDHPSDDRLLSGSNQALAAAGLQETVKKIIRTSGGRVERTQLSPAEAEGAFERIGLQVRGVGTIDTLQRTLHALESAGTLLFVHGLDISTATKRRRRRNKSQDHQYEAIELKATIDLFGYRRAVTK